MSVLERRPSYRESNKGSKERQGPTLGVRFTEVSVRRESTVSKFMKRKIKSFSCVQFKVIVIKKLPYGTDREPLMYIELKVKGSDWF